MFLRPMLLKKYTVGADSMVGGMVWALAKINLLKKSFVG
jgi:fructose-1-phosphate kinase PfkB-like protein